MGPARDSPNDHIRGETPDGGAEAFAATLCSHAEPSDKGPARGALYGRYTVLEQIGTGAMGVVLAAYDPRLDRKVALKQLSARVTRQTKRSAHARLLAEAQALAKLDHPNVVAVHDIDEHEGRLFVAMDLIEGQTLGAWLSEAEVPYAWAEVVHVFLAAGRGLAAAHAVDLVHRDFKPENVMLGVDGRVRVMDFGLARVAGTDDDDAASSQSASQPAGFSITAPPMDTGMLIGTPAYMSPEQARGDKADARSDQFSFCVALYEALYGALPFGGANIQELFDAISRGAIREPPQTVVVPGWLHQLVLRGLSTDPAQRFASMRALLDALEHAPSQRHQRVLGVGLAAGLVAGLAWIAAPSSGPEVDVCTQMAAELAGVWDSERRAEAHAAIAGTQLSYAQSTWARVEVELDVYTTRWIDIRTRACQANHMGTESDTLLDLRMTCLNRRLLEVEALVDVFAEADEQVVLQAVNAVHALRDVEQCVDAESLEAEIPLPSDPRVAARVDALSQRLIEADKLYDAGKYDAGLAIVDVVVSEAQVLDYPLLLVRAWLRQGQLRERLGNYEGSETSLELAYAHALEHVLIDEAAEAASVLIYVVGDHLARHHDGLRWGQDAQPLTRASGSVRRHARVLDNLGKVMLSQGKYERARDYYERAHAMNEDSFGRDHPILAKSFSHLGAVAARLGKYEQSRDYHERALVIKEQAVGPEHPDVAYSLNNLGTALAMLSEYEQARARHERALVIREQALGLDHPEYSASLNNLGNVSNALGEYERAKDLYAQALTIREQTLGPDHPMVAASLNNLATVAYNLEDYAQASTYHERALAIREQTLGPEHPAVARSLYNLAESERSRGEHERARQLYERALVIMGATLGPAHPYVAYPLTGRGMLALADQDFAEAISFLTRALEIHVQGEGLVARAEARFALARALWDAPPRQGRDREQARTLAELADADYRSSGVGSVEELAEVEAWLATHAGRGSHSE